MRYETESEKQAIQRGSRLAIQLNAAAESGHYAHLTADVVRSTLQAGDVFALLKRELPQEVWSVSKVTDVDCHELSRTWKTLAQAYEPRQFHVEPSGLALLVAYVLHTIAILHSTLQS